jgi:two-component system cell cycle sensor histidine kinase/response regulator CckA
MLVEAGFSVSDGTAEEALALARQPDARFDLLLTDIVMPDMTGGELAARFAALHPTTPVIFMTGYTDDQIVRAGVEAGMVPIVHKPFTADTLLAKVSEVLAGGTRGRA